MRRTVVVVVAVAVLAGCATTDPIWFIATPGYVESRIMASENALQADFEEKLAEKEARIRALETELDEQRTVAEELAALVDVINRLDESNQQLRDIASAAENRIDSLPEETLQLLIDILNDYLQRAEASTAE